MLDIERKKNTENTPTGRLKREGGEEKKKRINNLLKFLLIMGIECWVESLSLSVHKFVLHRLWLESREKKLSERNFGQEMVLELIYGLRIDSRGKFGASVTVEVL